MGRNAIEVLASEQGELRRLFERVSSPDDDRPRVLKELMQALVNHLAMEKEMLVPVLKGRAVDGHAIADQLTAQHDRLERTLTLLERRKVNSPDVPGLVTELLDINDEHAHTVETAIAPALRAALGPEELDELGNRMESDERSMLTRAHPLLPDSGPIATATRRVAEIVDRIRDHSSTSSGSSHRWPKEPPVDARRDTPIPDRQPGGRRP
ncbi:MAG: hemerythrin domain-containing protein [Acidimicrobiales bacterium]